MLCYLHSGLLVAGQTQQTKSSGINAVLAVIDAGKKLRNSGQLDAALSEFRRALRLSERLNYPLGQARSLTLIGGTQVKQYHYRVALDSLQKAVSMGLSIPSFQVACAAEGNIATIYSMVGDWASAEARAEQTVSFCRQNTHPDERGKPLLAKALQAHAIICFRLERFSEGYRDSDEAIKQAEGLKDELLQAMMWDVRGAALMDQSRVPEAESALAKALSLSEKYQSQEDLAYVKEHLAELELKKSQPNWNLALALINSSILSKAPGFKSAGEYYPVHIKARILLGMGNRSAAISEFMRAVDLANQWRVGALPGDTTGAQTTAALEDVYADYAFLAAQTALENKDDRLAATAWEVLAENRAASLRDQLRVVRGKDWKLPDAYFLKLSQLQSAQAAVTLGGNKPEDQARLAELRLEITGLENQSGIKSQKIFIFGEKVALRNSLRDIQRTMGRAQVVISIALGKQRSYMWAVRGDKVSLSKMPGELELQSKASAFASAVRLGHNTSSAGIDLSRALFAGLPPDVWNRSEWMLTVDGALLNGIPFCALPALGGAHAGKPLIDGQTLRFLPSELLLLDRQPEHPNRNFVGVGDPIYNQADGRLPKVHLADAKTISSGLSLGRLVGSNAEIRSAAKRSQSENPVLLTGANATREQLGVALNQEIGILHFAVHVVSPPDQPQQAALALSLINGVPEMLTSEVVASFHAAGSLVVLSGCSSGKGKVIPGAGLMGLSRAWLLAGAAAVIVSDWPTPDDSGKFFSSFYGHLGDLKSGDMAQRSAVALRQAQMDMQNGSGDQASPSFWAAFSVISKE